MYTLNKAPSKIVAKTRRGLPQKFESLDTLRDLTRKRLESDQEVEMRNWSSRKSFKITRSPKPVFHSTVNGRKLNSQHSQQEITPQHEEIIKYIYGSWNKVYKEYEQVQQELENGQVRSRSQNVMYYDDRSHCIEGFQPFDLEAWWGKRLFQNLTQST